jgi:hypothetical protein
MALKKIESSDKFDLPSAYPPKNSQIELVAELL